MIDIYKTTFRVFRANIGTIFLLIGLMEVLAFSGDFWDLKAGGMMIAQLIVILYLHMMVLFGKLPLTLKTDRKLPVGGFSLAALIIMLGAVISAVAVVILSGLPVKSASGLWVIVFCLFYFSLTVLLGTSLPTAAAGDAYNPKISILRAKSTWAGIAGGLIGGPIFVAVVAIAIVIFVAMPLGVTGGSYAQPSALGVTQVLLNLSTQFIGMIVSLLTVVVLCHAYKKVAPPEILAELKAVQSETA